MQLCIHSRVMNLLWFVSVLYRLWRFHMMQLFLIFVILICIVLFLKTYSFQSLCKFSSSKIHTGMYIDILCVLCSSKSGKCFLVEVPHRHEQTAVINWKTYTSRITLLYLTGGALTPTLTEFAITLFYEHSVGVHHHNFVKSWWCRSSHSV